MVAGRRNQSLFYFNHFRKPCNHPNLYAAGGHSRKLRLKTLPMSQDRHGMIDSFGFALDSGRTRDRVRQFAYGGLKFL